MSDLLAGLTVTLHGNDLHYVDAGDGDPVVFVHGLLGSHQDWTSLLADLSDRHRVLAPDLVGHGASAKLYEPAAYDSAIMAEDVRALLDHLGIARADVMGYSMGARITAFLALRHPRRARSAILGGLGIRLVDGVGLPLSIADALEAPSLADVADPTGRTFRAFAEQTKSDLRALAACIRGSRQTLTREQAGAIAVPALIAVGTKDDVAGSAQELAALMPQARALDIPDRDHMLSVGDRVFKAAVTDFLNERP